MKKRLHILYICFFILSFCLKGYGVNEFYFSHLGVSNGLSQTSVLCIFQDYDGYMWFGTRNGVNKFDGYRFKVYQHEVNNPTSISDGYICSIGEDKNKNIWLGTRNGLSVIDSFTEEITRIYPQDIDPDCKSNTIGQFLRHQNGELYAIEAYQVFRCNLDKTIESVPFLQEINASVYSIIQTENGDIYVGTRQEGLYIYSVEWELKAHYESNPKGLKNTTINCILEIDEEYIVLGTESEGVYLFNRENSSFIQLDDKNTGLSNNSVRSLINYRKNEILIGTFGGLNILTLDNKEIRPVKVDMEEKGSLSHFSIHSMLLDRTNTLWVGTYSAGINFYSPYFKPSSVITPKDFTGIIGKPQEDKEGNMWFATEGGGLLFYNEETGEEMLYPLMPISFLTYEENIIKTIYRKDDLIYCTTHFGKVYTFDIRTKKYKLLHDFGYYDIFSLYFDSKERLWVPTNSNYNLVMIENGNVFNDFRANGKDISFPLVTVMKELSPDVFLIGTLRDSLYLYNFKEERVENISERIKPAGKYEVLGAISSIECDSNYIWVSTTRSGLYKLNHKLELVKHYQKRDGLAESLITSLVIDLNQDIWVATGNMIYKLNSLDDQFSPMYPWNMSTREYTMHGGYVSSQGTVYFPGNRSIHSFEPQSLIKNPYIPSVHITGIYTDNTTDITHKYLKRKEIAPQKYVYSLTLPHSIRNLVIHYTALNYIHPNENEFLFTMEGINNNWTKAGNRRQAFYNSLRPGKYLFRIRAANSDGIWSPNDTLLYITIKPPFYKTWWATLIYIFFFSIIALKIIQYQYQKFELKRELRYKQKEQKKIKELHEERMRMFQNFSHELRTPLTLIINPLNELMKHRSFSPEIKNILRLMKKNTDRLLLLVNNLMDVQKYEAGQFTLHKKRFELNSFIKEIQRSFESIASNRQITFRVNNFLPDPWYVCYDEKEIEKVLFNLLSNAFKFTAPQGNVILNISSFSQEDCLDSPHIPPALLPQLNEQNYLFIQVYDTGKGFTKEEATKIFHPFYQSNEDIHQEVSGTGIGLSLTQSIITQHEGYIWAESIPEKESRFFILLPNNEKQESPVLETEIPKSQTNEKIEWINHIHSRNKSSLLIVDDNLDILNYLEKHLEEDYTIFKAVNGKDALEKLKEDLPDLIISDILMPQMNGLDLCKTVKSDPHLCHIPVILLTAQSMISQMQEGYAAEADDYITKPFDISLFKARIKNMLSLREKMKTVYGDAFSLKNLKLEQLDEKSEFLNRYIEIVKENLSDPDFDISIIYHSLGMSRPTFYRKVKNLTGLSPTDLITHIRLEVASHLLIETTMSINEVALAVGFSSRSYFTKNFKTVYGVSPSEYQKKGNNIA